MALIETGMLKVTVEGWPICPVEGLATLQTLIPVPAAGQPT